LTLDRVVQALEGLTGWRRWGLSWLAGVMAALALPPWQAVPLLWLAFPLLLWLLGGVQDKRRALLLGWWFGFGHFSLGLYWIAHALLVDPLRFGWMIPFAIFGLAGLLGIFTGLAVMVTWRSAPAGLPRILLLAVSWAAMEWLRSWILTGFPWNLMATVWLALLPVAQLAALVGPYGLGLGTVLLAGLPAILLERTRLSRGFFLVGCLALLAGAVWGQTRLPADPQPLVPGIRLRLVQPNIEQTLKWQPEMRLAHLRRHLALTASEGLETITHVIWSETAAPSFLDQDPVLLQRIAEAVPAQGLLLTGSARGTDPDHLPFRLWNSLLAINAEGAILASYDKAHLVPFGEYVPLRGLLPLAKLTAGSTDFSAGPGPVSLTLPGLPPFGPLICYEIIFPGEVVDPKNRPNWLLNVTNDGWFGLSAGPYQHFAAARLRAIEQGLPVVRAANSGISAVIDPFGRVVKGLGLGESGVVDSGLPIPTATLTPYARFGDSVALILASLLAISAVCWGKLSNRR